MKFVIAPDKYKGSLTGIEFCNAVENGIKKVISNAEFLHIPLADGGDGTMDALLYSLKGQKVKVEVNNPLFQKIGANYLWVASKKMAVIEMAEASGLSLLKLEDRNCMHTTSFGTGELIVDAIKKGVTTIVLGIGGSATNDGGMGMATALGYRFLDKNDEVLKPIGSNLDKVVTIDKTQVHPLLNNVTFKVACDVKNPLYGKNGAAYVYGTQKGASDAEIEILDKGLQSFSQVLLKQYTIDCQQMEGAGAAGGMGAGAVVFLNGVLTSGIELVKEITDFDKVINNADWIITGEGMLDNQTLSGKTITGVLNSANKQNIPVAAFCGSVVITEEEQTKLGITYVTSVLKNVVDIDTAIKTAYKNLVFSTYNFAKLIQ
ncbi:glycerate kinase [Wenyingzhuangia heitensis]|uniref:Glycerate kinase n=1 Tax=Wenyingzhuangia heitensis TaxID=1487859 RepID=A0ABX0UDF6_9FLAO|nr:glycerate kinase [Wenyingzhuangia heitensis]NIJ45092.1 glycerate kinase [Wenyingzhuangia heitensis]